MAVLTVTPANVRPLHQANVISAPAGAALALGDAVTLDTAGNLQKSVNASGKAIGIVVAGARGQATLIANELASVQVFGPLVGFSGMSPGRLAYLSATAGKLDDGGTVPVGYAIDATTLFVMPGIANAAS